MLEFMSHVLVYNNNFFLLHVIRDTFFKNYILGWDKNLTGHTFCLSPLSWTVGRDAYKENANLASSYPK